MTLHKKDIRDFQGIVRALVELDDLLENKNPEHNVRRMIALSGPEVIREVNINKTDEEGLFVVEVEFVDGKHTAWLHEDRIPKERMEGIESAKNCTCMTDLFQRT